MSWRRFFQRQKADAEQREELNFYLEVNTEEYIQRGLDPAAARETAQRKLGNTTLIREEIYGMNTLAFAEGVWGDTRHSLRMICLNPAFSAAAVLTLALGIGANTAMFSVFSTVLMRPLPYPKSDALVGVSNRLVIQAQVFEDVDLSPAMYVACKESARAFESFGVWSAGTATVTGLGDPEQLVTVTATQGVLPTLGIRPRIGKWFSTKDDSPGTPETVILSYGYWQRKFGGDPRAIGHMILVDFISRQVIGVMPPGFRVVKVYPDILLPQRFSANELTSGLKGEFSYAGLARLKRGVTVPLANEDLARVWKAWGETVGAGKMLQTLYLQPNLRSLKKDVVGDIGPLLALLMGALGLVLLLVCANVANLVLVRAESRQQEFAIRAALGGGWGTIAREVLVESLTLGVLGGVAGLVFAYLGLRVLVTQGPSNLPRIAEISLDGKSAGIRFRLLDRVRHTVRAGCGATLRPPGATAKRAGIDARSAATAGAERARHNAGGVSICTTGGLRPDDSELCCPAGRKARVHASGVDSDDPHSDPGGARAEGGTGRSNAI